jgi:F-type H+-transporting ATPase subunit delta
MKAALRYAKATLNLAKDQNKTSEVNDNMLLIAQTISDSVALKSFLNNPILKADVKLNVINSLFGNKINSISQGVLKILVSNKRLALLPFVAKQYTLLFDKSQGVEVAKITTAVTLTDALREKVLLKVKELTSKKVTVENIVDQKIIGGFILQIGDKQFDASIAGKLNNLRSNFKTNHYKAKI